MTIFFEPQSIEVQSRLKGFQYDTTLDYLRAFLEVVEYSRRKQNE